jgi:glycolate oxidase FAD binding subunit
MDPFLSSLRARIADATAAGTALHISGGATKRWYGQAPRGELLDMRPYRGITAYDPTELVITARCGTPLSELENALATQNQMLAFEPPRFGPNSTIGGVLAAGLSGPRRAAVGALRDFVLGAVLMDGQGEVLHFGGQVMKNVAGYDVSRLLAGSLGTLGPVLEMSLKVLPKPAAETSLLFEMTQAQAIEQLNDWSGMPLPISASCWQEGALTVRLSGAEAAVASACRKLGGEELGGAPGFWDGLRDQQAAFFTQTNDGQPLWRLSLPSVAAPLMLPGTQLVEWGGAQRWLRSEAEPAAIRAAAEKAGGHAAIFRGGDKAQGVFHPLAPALLVIHRKLKQAFDPAGIFNPGRMYTDL